jgi:hypothetical protein
MLIVPLVHSAGEVVCVLHSTSVVAAYPILFWKNAFESYAGIMSMDVAELGIGRFVSGHEQETFVSTLHSVGGVPGVMDTWTL